MSINDDDIIFRDLDGTEDSSDTEALKEQADNFENANLKADDDFEVADDEDEEEEGPDEKEEEQKEEPEEVDELASYKARAELADSATSEVEKLREKIRETQVQNVELELLATQQMSKSCNAELAAARAELLKAKEEGETEKELEASDKYQELLGHKRKIESHLESIKAKSEKYKTDPDAALADTGYAKSSTTQETKTTPNGGAEPTESGKIWIQKNSSWIFDSKKGTPEVKAFIQKIDGLIGGDPNSPEYFDTLNGMIKAKFPNLSPVGIKEQAKAGTKRSPSNKTKNVVAGVNSSSTTSTTRSTSSNKVTIDADDKRIMRTFGMDPTNKAHLRQYAGDKRALSKKN